MKKTFIVVAALLALLPCYLDAQAAESGAVAELTVRWSPTSQQLEASTLANKTPGSSAGTNLGAADAIRLDPYGSTGLPRSLRIVFEELPPGADGCGVRYKKGSRPPFKEFLMSVNSANKPVLMLTANTGSETASQFAIVCYDSAGNLVAELDPGSDNEDPAGDWP